MPVHVAVVHARHVRRPQRVVAERLDQVGRALGQPGVAVRGQVAGHQVDGREREHRERDLCSADRVRPRRGDHAELDQPRVQLAEPRMHVHASVDQLRRLGVERPVRGEQHVAREIAGGTDEHLHRLAIVVREVREPEQARDVEHLVEDQLDITIVDQRVRWMLHAR